MLERDYQKALIKRIKIRFPGCVVIKNDPGLRQGILDLTLLYGKHWACLEVKKQQPGLSDYEPNQLYYIRKFNDMSYAACIYPENEARILDELEEAFTS